MVFGKQHAQAMRQRRCWFDSVGDRSGRWRQSTGDFDAELSSPPGKVARVDVAAQATRQFAADRQAQSAATVLAGGRIVSLDKRREKSFEFFRIKANAGIAHSQMQADA